MDLNKRVIRYGEVRGVVKAPPSKNRTIRVIVAATLTPGLSFVANPSQCDDVLTALDIASALGAEVKWEGDGFQIRGNGGLRERPPLTRSIHCGSSGLCMRVFTPIVGLIGGDFTLDGLDSTAGKSMGNLEKLIAFGVKCQTNGGFAPIWLQGALRAGSFAVDEPESSQLLTGLLMALPLCKGESAIKISPAVNKSYLDLTLDLLREFGIIVSRDKTGKMFNIPGGQKYRPCKLVMEGDWATASFLLVAGAVAGSIVVSGLTTDTDQPEKAVLYALDRAGAEIEVLNGSISVRKHRLTAFDFDTADCPHLVPPLVALAALCRGKSVLYGTDRLRSKEQERIHRLVSVFSSLGIRIEAFPNRLEIEGGQIRAGAIDALNDHRIAMSCAVAALSGAGDLVIGNSTCVSRSYPSFFDDLDSVKTTI